MTLKKIYRFAIDNYFISIFLACVAFVAVVSVYKLFFVQPTYVYAKVKMGQGLWWASTQKPPPWFVEGLKKEMEEKDLTGKPIAKILSIRYYPWWTSGQYDVYLTMKLKVTKMGSGKYNFKRSAIGVGSPVDFEFPTVQFSGTIIELSEKPFKEKYFTKRITLVKKWAFPWEADAVKVGDYYFDGEEVVFKVIDKKVVPAQSAYNFSGTYYPVESERKVHITITAEMKIKKRGLQLVFGEEQPIILGKTINLSTEHFVFQDYVVSKIETQ